MQLVHVGNPSLPLVASPLPLDPTPPRSKPLFFMNYPVLGVQIRGHKHVHRTVALVCLVTCVTECPDTWSNSSTLDRRWLSYPTALGTCQFLITHFFPCKFSVSLENLMKTGHI
jgi:hypothetical protein